MPNLASCTKPWKFKPTDTQFEDPRHDKKSVWKCQEINPDILFCHQLTLAIGGRQPSNDELALLIAETPAASGKIIQLTPDPGQEVF